MSELAAGEPPWPTSKKSIKCWTLQPSMDILISFATAALLGPNLTHLHQAIDDRALFSELFAAPVDGGLDLKLLYKDAAARWKMPGRKALRV